LDDFQFESDKSATPQELLQFKHSISNQATLTNLSPELWKTIGNWSKLEAEDRLGSGTILTLITTALAPDADNNIPSLLRPYAVRDLEDITKRLREAAETSISEQLRPYIERFCTLSSMQQQDLVSRVRILDGSSNIWATPEKIKGVLLERPEHLDGIYQRLEGWWFARVIRHLEETDDRITKSELLLELNDIREQFRADSLPIDFSDADPPEEMFLNQEQLQFVRQLTEISLLQPRIEWAIRDYYRAFAQRTRWVEEKLINFEELQKYENRLCEEWDQHRLAVLQKSADRTTDVIKDPVQVGQELYDRVMICGQEIPIRLNMPKSSYVMRGSYHIMADKKPEPRIWWHPTFVDRLREILAARTDILNLLKQKSFTGLPSWQERPLEIANMLNPAFCAVVLHDAIKGYERELAEGMPYSLLFLVFPIVLHKPTRNLLPTNLQTKLHPWLQRNPAILPEFPERTRQFTPITKEALVFGMQKGAIKTENARFLGVPRQELSAFLTDGAGDLRSPDAISIRKKAGFCGRWLAQAGNVSSIYSWWGIRL